MLRPPVFLVTLALQGLRAIFCSREELLIENLALRQQVAALKKERPRPVLDDVDRAFWVALRASWPGWASRLVIVNPDMVAKWHRDRYRRHWAKNSHARRSPGRPRVSAEIRHLIRKMARDGWGAPRIHGELMKLGYVVSEITVSRYMPHRPVEPDQLKRWIGYCQLKRFESETEPLPITARSPRAVACPRLLQIRTCPIRASGSSDYGVATRR